MHAVEFCSKGYSSRAKLGARDEGLMRLDLSKFRIRSATLEVRYPNTFLIWDQSGAVWEDVGKKYAELAVNEAEPNKVNVQIDEKTQGVIGINRTHCSASEPNSDLGDFCDVCSILYKSLFSRLGISTLTRIGLRLIFDRAFEDRKAAADFVVAQSSLEFPSGKHFNIEGKLLDPEISFRIEDDDLGYSLRMKSQETALNVNLPL